MTKKILASLFVCLFSYVAMSQMSYIQTKADKVLAKDYKTFVIVDQANGYALAKSPVKYKQGGDNPMCYFTVDLPTGVTQYPTGVRKFIIHTLQATDQDWVLENSDSEKDAFFGRARFVAQPANKEWVVKVDGEHIVFQSRTQGGEYLAISADGNLKRTKSYSEASKWTLYHIY